MNYLSRPFEKTEIINTFDANLAAKTLAMRQGKYDANKAQIDQTLALYKNQLKGLKDVDNEYIATRLSEVQSLVKTYGEGKDFSLASNTEPLLQSLQKVTEDPIIRSAVLNKTIYDQGNLAIDAKRKKGDGTYSDTNYQDWKDRTGVDKYLSGEIENLNRVNYDDYVNVNEKLSKKAKEYVDLMGKKQLLDKTTNEYYFEDVYGEKVTMDDIYSRLSSELDEKDLRQLQINARQSYGKMSQSDLESKITPQLRVRVEASSVKKAEIEAKLKSETDPVKIENYKMQLLNVDDRIKNYNTQLNTKQFDIYGAYKENFLTEIADDYDYSIITDIKRDDLKFQVYKFETEEAWREKNYQQKEREQKALETATSPTITEKPQLPEDVAPPVEKVLKRNLQSSDSALDAYLKSTNESNYNSKTPQEQWAYKVNLSADNPTQEGNTLERQNLVKAFKTTQRGYSELINKNTDLLTENIGKQFNAIKGANLNNLSVEMPYTVAILRQGKKFEDLDKNVQKGILVEMGSNWVRHGGLTDRESDNLMSILNATKAKLENHPSEKVKSIAKTISSEVNKPSLITSTNVAGSTMFLMNLTSRSLNQDTDIIELEQYTGDTNQDIIDTFKTGLQAIINNTETKASELNKNLVSNKAMSWSTEIKGQADDAERIKQAIQVNHPDVIPVNNNNYTVSRQGTGFNITFSVKEGNGVKPQTVYVERLSDDLQSKLNTKEASWNNSYTNPNIILPKFVFSEKDNVKAYEDFTKLAKNRPDILPMEAKIAIFNAGTLKGTTLQSDDDRLEIAMSSPNFTKEKLPAIENILKATYGTKFEVENGKLLGSIQIVFPQGKPTQIMMQSATTELDEGRIYTEVMEQIGRYKEQEINKILSK